MNPESVTWYLNIGMCVLFLTFVYALYGPKDRKSSKNSIIDPETYMKNLPYLLALIVIGWPIMLPMYCTIACSDEKGKK